MPLTTDFIDDLLKKAEDITVEVHHQAHRGVVDFIASSMAAKGNPDIEKLIAYYGQHDDGLAITGYDARLIPVNAVRVNAYIAHYLDLDDVHSDVRGHPSVVILPALLAVGDANITAERFLTSYIVGIEAMAVIGKHIGRWHYEHGWHASSTLGTLAAAIAVSYLLDLPAEKIENALGIAVTQASGVRSQFGSEMKPFQLANAAADGFEAARLSAADVITSNKDQLASFFKVYGQQTYEHLDVADTWAIDEPGLWFKLYPCCSANYHAIDALTEIIEAHDVTASSVGSVELVYPPGGDAALIHKQPATRKEGMFSVEYVTALLLQRKSLDYSSFTDEAIDEETIRIMKKVNRTYDDSIVPNPDALPKGRFTIARVTTLNGHVYNARIDAPAGSPKRPLSDEVLLTKLQSYLTDAQDADEILTDLNEAVTLTDIKTIIGAIR